MLFKLFLYSSTKGQAESLGRSILSNFNNFISTAIITENVQYWKIKELRVVNFKIKLNVDENKVRESCEWEEFLKTIADKWERFGYPLKNNFVISENFPNLNYIRKNVAFVNIIIGDET